MARTTAEALRSQWPTEQEAVMIDRLDAAGQAALRLSASPAGHLLESPAAGLFQIRANNRSIICAPAAVPTWRWQRFLVGQALPFTSTLCGLEVLHASAVAFAQYAIALIGSSGAGKSSLALEMIRRGARFVTDDVLAIETLEDAVLALPGMGLANLRRYPFEATNPLARAVGRPIGGDTVSLRLALPVERLPLPLRAIYFLDRRTEPDRLSIAPLVSADPRLILGANFNLVLRSHERLIRHLDISARVTLAAEAYSVSIPRGDTSTTVGAAVFAHATQ